MGSEAAVRRRVSAGRADRRPSGHRQTRGTAGRRSPHWRGGDGHANERDRRAAHHDCRASEHALEVVHRERDAHRQHQKAQQQREVVGRDAEEDAGHREAEHGDEEGPHREEVGKYVGEGAEPVHRRRRGHHVRVPRRGSCCDGAARYRHALGRRSAGACCSGQRRRDGRRAGTEVNSRPHGQTSARGQAHRQHGNQAHGEHSAPLCDESRRRKANGFVERGEGEFPAGSFRAEMISGRSRKKEGGKRFYATSYMNSLHAPQIILCMQGQKPQFSRQHLLQTSALLPEPVLQSYMPQLITAQLPPGSAAPLQAHIHAPGMANSLEVRTDTDPSPSRLSAIFSPVLQSLTPTPSSKAKARRVHSTFEHKVQASVQPLPQKPAVEVTCLFDSTHQHTISWDVVIKLPVTVNGKPALLKPGRCNLYTFPKVYFKHLREDKGVVPSEEGRCVPSSAHPHSCRLRPRKHECMRAPVPVPLPVPMRRRPTGNHTRARARCMAQVCARAGDHGAATQRDHLHRQARTLAKPRRRARFAW